MRLAHIGVVTLVNQVFLGGDIVVKAGLGKTQTACHIGQRGRSRSLGIKQLGGTGKHRSMLGFTLQTAAEGRAMY